MKSIKITPLFIAFIIAELVLTCIAIYYLLIDSGGGMALAGTIAFIGVIIILIAILIEQFIANINGINLKILRIVEFIILCFLIIYFSIMGISIG